MCPSWEAEESFLRNCGVDPSVTIKPFYTQQTVEHLKRLADGGGCNKKNLVLAHSYCNSTRQLRTPAEQKERTKAEMEAGTHPLLPLKNWRKKKKRPVRRQTERP